MPFFVYLLANRNVTYVGATVDLDHRLRQHNQEIKGGAHYTSSKGTGWRRVAYVKNFPTWKSALQFEWRWKQLTRKRGEKTSLEKRMGALEELLSLEQATEKAVPYSEWSEWPEVVLEEY